MIPTILAIVSLTILETIALIKGIDGALLSLIVSAIAGLGGYTIARKTTKR